MSKASANGAGGGVFGGGGGGAALSSGGFYRKESPKFEVLQLLDCYFNKTNEYERVVS